jgi:hypothetical protein
MCCIKKTERPLLSLKKTEDSIDSCCVVSFNRELILMSISINAMFTQLNFRFITPKPKCYRFIIFIDKGKTPEIESNNRVH